MCIYQNTELASDR